MDNREATEGVSSRPGIDKAREVSLDASVDDIWISSTLRNM